LFGSKNVAALIHITGNRINISSAGHVMPVAGNEKLRRPRRTAVTSAEELRLLVACAILTCLSAQYFNSPSACRQVRRVGNQAMNASTKIVHHISLGPQSGDAASAAAASIEMRRVGKSSEYDLAIPVVDISEIS